jgi:hypothetical protein
MAKKKKLSREDEAAREIAHACSIIEDLIPEVEGSLLGNELSDALEMLDAIQTNLQTGGYELPKPKKRAKAASAGK